SHYGYCTPASLVSHLLFFSFNATAPPVLYTLSLHDALPISTAVTNNAATASRVNTLESNLSNVTADLATKATASQLELTNTEVRSEEHTSELQSRFDLVCRLLLEKKKNKYTIIQLKLERTKI